MVNYSAEILTPSYVDLPESLCQRSAGLALDIGSSLIKVAFFDKDTSSQDGESPIAKGMKRIRLRFYKKDEWEKVLTDLSACALISQDHAVNITGIGAKARGTELEEKLNVKTKIMPQIDCDMAAFTQLLKNLPKGELSLPDHEESLAEAKVFTDAMKAMMGKMQEHTDYQVDFGSAEKKTKGGATSASKDNFPCVLVTLGTRAEAVKITKDGKVEMLGNSFRAGGSFMGVSHLTAEAKSYEDAVNLAVLGRERDVSTFSSDLIQEDAEKDMYSDVLDADTILFMHGKAVDKDRDAFPKESRARSIVLQFTTDLAQFIHECTVLGGLRHAYLAGNFQNAEIIRGELTKHLYFHEAIPVSQEPVTYTHTFLKHGGYLGAIGALIVGKSDVNVENCASCSLL